MFKRATIVKGGTILFALSSWSMLTERSLTGVVLRIKETGSSPARLGICDSRSGIVVVSMADRMQIYDHLIFKQQGIRRKCRKIRDSCVHSAEVC
jgi:hypothetical protein